MRKTAFLLLCWMSASLSGATYYVSPAGSDKNPGTDPARPAKSINRILQKTKSGDTVMLKGGIYREQISMEWANKNPNPITIKAFPDETPVISWGWRVKGWEKLANGLMVADFPYAVCDILQKITLDRYLKVDSMELLRRQPGAFLQDPGNGKIYLNPLDGSWHKDPESAGFIAVPYAGRVRPPSWKAESSNRRPGMNLVGHNIHVDGLSFEFHPAKGFYLRGRQKGLFYGSGSIRNCCAVGTTCGLSTGWYVDGVTFENCVSIRNSGAGLHTGGAIKNIRIINNFLFNNGSSLPFYGNYTAGSGNVYNLAHYGGSDAAFVDVINNKVISVDKSRSGGVMRYKPGIRKHTNHLNNLYLGGGVTLYSVPGSTASIRNNSVLPGIFNFTVPNTGEKYTPDMKDNLELRPRAQLKKARFVNPEKLDYRLLPDSKYLGKGFAPAAAPVWFVKPGSKGGDGRTPEKPLSSLAELQSKIKSGDTVYFMAGNYSGSLTLKNLKDVVLSDMSFNSAKWNKCLISFEKCSIKVENMDFDSCTFNMKDTQSTFKENLFKNVTFAAAAGKVILANSDLEKCVVKSSGRVVVRENILNNVNLAAKEVVSEHNGFMTAQEFKKWPFKETFQSFVAGVNGTVPLKNRLHGSRGTWIGGRVIPDKKPPLVVEYAKVTPLSCGTRALVSWNTPKDYVEAYLTVRQGTKRIFYDRVRFGQYLKCSNDICIPDLKPGTVYEAELTLARHNEACSWQKKIRFSTPKIAQKSVPRILEVGKGKKFIHIADAVRAASNGDTVLIAPGFYPEIINVFADNVTIKAAKPGTVRISGANMFDYTIQAANVKGLTVDGIDFVDSRYSSSSRMISLFRSERTKIINCRFLAGAARRMGNLHIFGRYIKGFEVKNCVFDKAFHSIWLMESEKVLIDHNTIWGSGINAMHIAGGNGAKVTITNNLCVDVVANHVSPAISVGHSKTRLVCDWNMYWFTKKRCPFQKVFGMGGKLGIHSVGQVMRQDAYVTIDECRKHYGVEKNGLFADPKMKDPEKGDFTLAADSPARKRGSDGKDIGADLTVWE